MADTCQECGHSVAPGSGRFVNRVPADNGWLCVECLHGIYDCGHCNQPIGHDEDCFVEPDGPHLCPKCAKRHLAP